MRRVLMIVLLLPLLATDPSWPPPDSSYNPGSDFPDELGEGGATCGRSITCLDGATVSCANGPSGECSYQIDKCNYKREHHKGWVQCGKDADKEYCNRYQCPP